MPLKSHKRNFVEAKKSMEVVGNFHFSLAAIKFYQTRGETLTFI